MIDDFCVEIVQILLGIYGVAADIIGWLDQVGDPSDPKSLILGWVCKQGI